MSVCLIGTRKLHPPYTHPIIIASTVLDNEQNMANHLDQKTLRYFYQYSITGVSSVPLRI